MGTNSAATAANSHADVERINRFEDKLRGHRCEKPRKSRADEPLRGQTSPQHLPNISPTSLQHRHGAGEPLWGTAAARLMLLVVADRPLSARYRGEANRCFSKTSIPRGHPQSSRRARLKSAPRVSRSLGARLTQARSRGGAAEKRMNRFGRDGAAATRASTPERRRMPRLQVGASKLPGSRDARLTRTRGAGRGEGADEPLYWP